MSQSNGDDGTVMPLTSSTLLQESTPSKAFSLHRTPLPRWTAEDIRQHVFFLLWVCGIPVHVRYVAHLLQHSAVGQSHAGAAASPASYPAMAQRDVLAQVHQRGGDVNSALRAWPSTSAFAPVSPLLSFIVPLGIAEATTAAAAAAAEATQKERAEGVKEAKSSAESCRSGAMTPKPQQVATASGETHDVDELTAASSPSACTVQAVAVEPEEGFANVMALALYSPAEGANRQVGSVDPSWCSRAYWTAASQSQNWIACFSKSGIAEEGEEEVLRNGAASAAPPLRTLVPSAPASSNANTKRKRRQADASPAPVETVIVDAEDEVMQPNTAGVAAAASGPSAPSKIITATFKSAKAEVAVIVIDSDDE
ncbi:hypothetical protein ABL78_5287 [Leptomonas seymouri]|uniref:Uncharacterized protein n=1 Tax=Leptomonas seymouri TaxID=5684 RepID=A0A0N0P4T4_LEPSE|nr:hypothetical protein ABL78_5287 [Leptomonas seymouri]|eukprot:KPI85666.1 hypothetical protein ABL78_5287 [Leptomonas seymouri]